MTESKTPAANIITDLEPSGYVEYEIDIERVLRDDLPSVLDRIPVAALTEANVNRVPAGAKGAYVLFENDVAVYAGKTDTRHGFRDRLNRHACTIQHRHNLDPQAIGFKAIRILVFSNFDVEAILMQALRKADPAALRWNTTGFGSNDPGHNREAQEPAQFDRERPIDIDRPLDWIVPGATPTAQLLGSLKRQLPYILRFETQPGRNRQPHPDYLNARPAIIRPDAPRTVRTALSAIVDALGPPWRATIFPDRVILYREQTRYPHALESLGAA